MYGSHFLLIFISRKFKSNIFLVKLFSFFKIVSINFMRLLGDKSLAPLVDYFIEDIRYIDDQLKLKTLCSTSVSKLELGIFKTHETIRYSLIN